MSAKFRYDMINAVFCSVVLFLAVSMPSRAQRVIRYSPNSPAMPLEVLARDADVIVMGTVANGRPVVLEDTVYTDRTLNVQRMLFQKINVFSNKTPGTPSTLEFTHGGGTALVNNELITAMSDEFPSDAFAPGAQVVLFLTYVPQHQRFFLTSGAYSAFYVQNGTISPLKRNPHETRRVSGASSDRFISDVEWLITTRRVR